MPSYFCYCYSIFKRERQCQLIGVVWYSSIPAEAPIPINVVLSINHSIFVKGDHTNFEIEPSFGFEASELYPDVKYTTVEEYLSRFV